MKLSTNKYECKMCGNNFKNYVLPGFPYGEFLLRDDNGNLKYFLALESKEFIEIGEIVDLILKGFNLSDLSRVGVLHKIFGIFCDQYSKEYNYEIGKKFCPDCHSKKIISWGPAHPGDVVDINVSSITFEKWNELTKGEKFNKVKIAVEDVMQHKDELGIF